MTDLSKHVDVLNRSASRLSALRALFAGTDENAIPGDVGEVAYNSLANVECELRRIIATLEADINDNGPEDGGEPMSLEIVTPRLYLVCEKRAA
jgi:hypothetical protein